MYAAVTTQFKNLRITMANDSKSNDSEGCNSQQRCCNSHAAADNDAPMKAVEESPPPPLADNDAKDVANNSKENEKRKNKLAPGKSIFIKGSLRKMNNSRLKRGFKSVGGVVYVCKKTNTLAQIKFKSSDTAETLIKEKFTKLYGMSVQVLSTKEAYAEMRAQTTTTPPIAKENATKVIVQHFHTAVLSFYTSARISTVPDIYFNADKPFFLAIVDKNGRVFFSGRYNKI